MTINKNTKIQKIRKYKNTKMYYVDQKSHATEYLRDELDPCLINQDDKCDLIKIQNYVSQGADVSKLRIFIEVISDPDILRILSSSLMCIKKTRKILLVRAAELGFQNLVSKISAFSLTHFWDNNGLQWPDIKRLVIADRQKELVIIINGKRIRHDMKFKTKKKILRCFRRKGWSHAFIAFVKFDSFNVVKHSVHELIYLLRQFDNNLFSKKQIMNEIMYHSQNNTTVSTACSQILIMSGSDFPMQKHLTESIIGISEFIFNDANESLNIFGINRIIYEYAFDINYNLISKFLFYINYNNLL